jgi:hypothetical protein
LRSWNDTKILSFAPAKDCDAEEMEETLVATLKQLAKTISRDVVIGGVGAYAVDDDVDQYYLVKWTQVSRKLLHNEIIMVENTMTTVFLGDWICEGRWLNRVERARYWYMVGDTVVTVRMKNVLHAHLAKTPISVNNPLPCLHPTVRDQVMPLNPHKMRSIDHDFMMDEISWRDAMNFEEEVISSDNHTNSDGDEDSDDNISDDDDDANDGND